MSSGHPSLQAWVAFLQGDLVFAGAALDRVGRAAAEYDAVAHGMGQIFANMAQAGIHLERREHEPAATLLAAARAGGTDQRPPGPSQSMVDTWIARLATARGDRAGALASLAQARLALAAPDDRVRAQFALEEFRVAVALAPAEAGALIPRLPANTASRLLQARLHVLRREWAKAEQILEETEPVTIRERVEWGVLRSLAAQAADLDAGAPLPADGPGAGPAPRVPGHHHRAGTRHRRLAPFPASRHRSQALRR